MLGGSSWLLVYGTLSVNNFLMRGEVAVVRIHKG